MREGSSTPVRALHDVPEAMALLSLSRTQIYELIPSPLRLSQLFLCLPRAGIPKLQQMSPGVQSCYPPALSTNQAQGQLAGRQATSRPPRHPAGLGQSGGRDRTTTGRKMMIMPRVTVKSEVVPLRYRVDEAATALRLSRSSVYELIRSGQLRTVKQGRRRLVPVTALAEYVASLGGAA